MTIIEENSKLVSRRYSKKDYLGASFDTCVLYKCVFKLCTFNAGDFTYCTLIECDFNNFNFYWGLHLNNTFVSCNFTDVKFCGIDLKDVTFVNCVFNRVEFRPDNLASGCNLEATNFIDCEFKNCISLNSAVNEENPLPKGMSVKNLASKDIDLVS